MAKNVSLNWVSLKIALKMGINQSLVQEFAAKKLKKIQKIQQKVEAQPYTDISLCDISPFL